MSSNCTPDQLNELERALRHVLGSRGAASTFVDIVDCKANINTSRFESRIVTCRMRDDLHLRLLCKYHDIESYTDYGHGHRGGVLYEADVYRDILEPLPITTPPFFGRYFDPERKRGLLVIGYLDDALRINKSADPKGIVKAAHWIGRFHALNEQRVSEFDQSSLIRYDAEFYVGWALRTGAYAKDLHKNYPWLRSLCEAFVELVPRFAQRPRTIIHGEYVVKNVLLSDGVVYPVDWESAAIGQGEIDLAMLTDGWPEDVVDECKTAYREARWPDGSNTLCAEALEIAVIYTQLRWMGDWPQTTCDKAQQFRFERMRQAAERMQLI